MIRVRLKSEPTIVYDGLWLMSNNRLVIAKNSKPITSIPIQDLEVEVHSTWICLELAYQERKISFLGMVVAIKKENA